MKGEMSTTPALPYGLPAPRPSPDGLDAPYWAATRRHQLSVQRCERCSTFQWGPEWICHRCRSFNMGWEVVAPEGVIYSWERVWHPVHPAVAEACPYVVVLVELPHAGRIRMVGNLIGGGGSVVNIGDPVAAVFEDHDDPEKAYTLVQWRAD